MFLFCILYVFWCLEEFLLKTFTNLAPIYQVDSSVTWSCFDNVVLSFSDQTMKSDHCMDVNRIVNQWTQTWLLLHKYVHTLDGVTIFLFLNAEMKTWLLINELFLLNFMDNKERYILRLRKKRLFYWLISSGNTISRTKQYRHGNIDLDRPLKYIWVFTSK